jgi:hypothetical protein
MRGRSGPPERVLAPPAFVQPLVQEVRAEQPVSVEVLRATFLPVSVSRRMTSQTLDRSSTYSMLIPRHWH